MEQKIDALFKVAIKNKHDSLILGALGCGVFKNPPEVVAELFRQAVVKYGCHFKKIGFAVLTTKNSDANNFIVFNKTFNLEK